MLALKIPYIVHFSHGKVLGYHTTYPNTIATAVYEASAVAYVTHREHVVAWVTRHQSKVESEESFEIELLAAFDGDGLAMSEVAAIGKFQGPTKAFLRSLDEGEDAQESPS